MINFNIDDTLPGHLSTRGGGRRGNCCGIWVKSTYNYQKLLVLAWSLVPHFRVSSWQMPCLLFTNYNFILFNIRYSYKPKREFYQLNASPVNKVAMLIAKFFLQTFEILKEIYPQLLYKKDGTWTPSELPTCVPVQCGLPESPVNGKAHYTALAYKVRFVYLFVLWW